MTSKRSIPKNPLIAIVGCTGTGKSQLAVTLSRHLNGEIINADALQLYNGLPLLTNKIPVAEQNGVPHHLLGNVALTEEPWSVHKFRREALKIIKEIRGRGNVPVLVGGTAYYVQSLVGSGFSLVDSDRESDADTDFETETESTSDDTSGKWPILDAPTEQILAELRSVDPLMADRWHPNDRRKLRRSLEIYLTTGKRASEVYAAQHARKQSQSQVHLQRQNEADKFDTLLLIPHTPLASLSPRLTARIENMFTSGLAVEVASLHATYTQFSPPPDITRGIWVAIGYREFLPYVLAASEAVPSGTTADAENANQNALELQKLKDLKDSAIEQTHAHTRRYAKQQLRWLRYKFVPPILGATDAQAEPQTHFYVLDHTTCVQEAAGLELARKFLAGSAMPTREQVCPEALLRDFGITTASVCASGDSPVRLGGKGRRGRWTCEICNMTTVWEDEWTGHLKSRRHKRTVQGMKKREALVRSGRLKQALPNDTASAGRVGEGDDKTD